MLQLLFTACIQLLLFHFPKIQAFSPPATTSRFRRIQRIRQQHPVTISQNNRLTLFLSNDNDSQGMDRLIDVRQAVSEIANTGLKDSVQAGDVIIAKVEIPNLQIYANQGYRIVAIYDQYVDDQGQVGKIPVDQLDRDSTTPSGYTRYLQLELKDGTRTVVTPEEIGLVTLKDEMVLSIWLAIPGFFWVVVAWNFAHYYNERHGGNFLDAMFRT